MHTDSLKSLFADLPYLWKESWGVRALVTAISVASCLAVGASLFFVWITKRIVDSAVSPDHCVSSGDVIALVACLLFQLAVPAARRRMEVIATTRYSNRMRSRLLDHVVRTKWSSGRNFHSGDAINRMLKDVDTLSSLTCLTLPGIPAVIFQLVGAFVFIAVLDIRIALGVVFIMPVALVVSKLYLKKTRQLTSEIRKRESDLFTFLQEGLHNRTLLSTLMGTDLIAGRFDGMQDSLTGMLLRKVDISIFSNAAVTVGFMTGYAVTFVWSAYGLASGAVSFGMMTAFLQLVSQVQRPAVDLSRRIPSFINASVAAERLQEIWALPLEDCSKPSVGSDEPVGLQFADVCYSYPDEKDKVVVDRLSHNFMPGSITAIIGPTGAGKTTLLRLLLGLIEPTSGKATVYTGNGGEYEIGPGLRNNIVYVPQGNTLMYGTVRDNLLLGNPDATDEMMKRALWTAAAEFIADLPDGLDTMCLERGTGFSEGQAQRIAIARGLLKGGNIFILDEPTSALDQSTEKELLTRLIQNLPTSSTVIIVTHRREVLKFCTDILDLTIT